MNIFIQWVEILDIIQFMSPHLWMYTQRHDHCHPEPLVPIGGIRFGRFGKIQNHDLGDLNPRSMELVTWSLPLGYAPSNY